MHPNNLHKTAYDFNALKISHPELEPHISRNEYGNLSIDFSNPEAVLHLNKAILKHHYDIFDWNIPAHYLCPPIPGRADYLHHIFDLLKEIGAPQNEIKGLDIGVGANCIYPILGAKIFNWNMVGCDIDPVAIASAKANVNATEGLDKRIEIRQQENNSNILRGIVKEGEKFDFSMCNPPFHTSRESALKGSIQKWKNLGENSSHLNFGGQANELWCNGGEALFIKRLIKESVLFKKNIRIFTTLVSKKENLFAINKQLSKLGAQHKVINMELGNKKSRIVVWSWNTSSF